MNISCVLVTIIDDQIRENLYENFTFALGVSDSSRLTTLTINTTPATIRIQDDDRKFQTANIVYVNVPDYRGWSEI